MIDLHCHILSDVDDGAKRLQDSMRMAKVAFSQGIHTIIATPHHKNGRYINIKEQVVEKVKSLNEQLKIEGIPVTILPGQEIRLYGDIIKDYERGELLSVNDNSKYIFIEFPSNSVPNFTDRLFYELHMKGLIPIIVHPERNNQIIENPSILYNLINKGALSQITAASLVGRFGKKIKKFSFELIDHNLTHAIASDAHNIEGRNFFMEEAYEIIKKIYGVDMVDIFHNNAFSIVNGKACYQDTPQQIIKKKFLRIF